MPQQRDPQALLAEAAALRQQAAAVHRAVGEALSQENTRWGALRDRAVVDARATRASADEAAKLAQELDEEATRWRRSTALYGEGGTEEDMEDARASLRLGASVQKRADHAHQQARELAHKATALEKQVKELNAEPKPTHLRRMEAAADALDDKARLLTGAAEELRGAEMARSFGNQPAARLSEMQARHALSRADDIRPDISDIDPAILRATGIPLSQVPGMELMEPLDPPASAALDPVNPPIADAVAATAMGPDESSDVAAAHLPLDDLGLPAPAASLAAAPARVVTGDPATDGFLPEPEPSGAVAFETEPIGAGVELEDPAGFGPDPEVAEPAVAVSLDFET